MLLLSIKIKFLIKTKFQNNLNKCNIRIINNNKKVIKKYKKNIMKK